LTSGPIHALTSVYLVAREEERPVRAKDMTRDQTTMLSLISMLTRCSKAHEYILFDNFRRH